jgi:hypothetical protein
MRGKRMRLNIKSCLLIMSVLICLVVPSFATGQAPDKIIYDGKERALFANPLEDYYSKGKDRPDFMIRPGTISTGNWRGYVATWEIKDNVLYMRNIDSWIKDRRVTMTELFGDQYKDGRVKASWFSDELRIPDGKELQYVHMGYGSVYERDIILTIEKGMVTRKSVIDNTKRKLPSSIELQKQELDKMDKKSRPEKPE